MLRGEGHPATLLREGRLDDGFSLTVLRPAHEILASCLHLTLYLLPLWVLCNQICRENDLLRISLLSPELIEVLAKVLHNALARMLRLVHHTLYCIEVT